MSGRLLRAQPRQHSPWNLVFADDRLVPAEAAQLALDEIGMHGLGGGLEQRLTAVLASGMLLEPCQGQPRLLAGASECGSLLGENLVAEKIEP